MAFRDMQPDTSQLWGAVVAVSAALAVVAGYLLGGPQLVGAIAAVEVLLVMACVAWRFRDRAHLPTTNGGPDAAHCERCRRARERLDAEG